MEEHRQRSLEHVRRALATLGRVLRRNRAIAAQFPGHRQSAERRIAEAEDEIVSLESQQGELESQRVTDPR